MPACAWVCVRGLAMWGSSLPSSACYRNAFSSSDGGSSRAGRPSGTSGHGSETILGADTLIFILFCLSACLLLAKSFFLWASALFSLSLCPLKGSIVVKRMGFGPNCVHSSPAYAIWGLCDSVQVL